MSSAPRATLTAFLASLTEAELEFLAQDWRFWGRDEQLAPESPEQDWTTWLFLGGRGAGKTRAGAEWVRERLEAGEAARVALVAETQADARAVMVEGPSGLLALPWRDGRPRFLSSRRLIIWPNGATGHLFSAEEPDGLRGHQFDLGWCDELAKWPNAQETWDMLQLGMRLGRAPRQVVTTTPRPMPLVKSLLCDPHTVVTRASTFANRAHLARSFFSQIIARFEGTRLGRQELNAEILEDRSDALWRWDMIESARVAEAPPLRRVVVAVDPPASVGPEADACGIVVAGVDGAGEAYVLADRTVQGLSPLGWARAVVDAYHDFEADRIVAEVNQGGALVETVLRQIDPAIPYRAVRAVRAKEARAEPVAALYEQARVHHVGPLPKLEDELCAYEPGQGVRGHSPDRLDALVWALTDLVLGATRAEPRVRRL